MKKQRSYLRKISLPFFLGHPVYMVHCGNQVFGPFIQRLSDMQKELCHGSRWRTKSDHTQEYHQMTKTEAKQAIVEGSS